MSNFLREKQLHNNADVSKLLRTQRSLLQTVDVEMMETSEQLNAHAAVDTEQMLERFVAQILPILTALGPGISYDTASIFTKLIRICQAFLNEKKFFTQSASATVNVSNGVINSQSQKEQTPPPQPLPQLQNTIVPPSQIVKQMSRAELAFFNQIYTLLNEILLPSLSMLNMNPCLAIELWNLLKLFPYEMRFVRILYTPLL